MKTDKQLYRIFEANPDWIFQLARLPSPGKSSLRSVTIKSLERKADGVIVPEAFDPPLTVVEFQFQKEETIYTRTVAEMIAVQEANQMRPVQGLIFFGYNNLDPQTAPWNRVVQAFVLRDLVETFERDHPEHPLAAVFKPLLMEDEVALESEAVGYYRTIKYSQLPTACKTGLLEAFVSWLEQRLNHKTKREIEIMLLGELPELEETQSGKDLIRIGEERGIRVGEERGIRVGEERGIRVGEERGIRVGEERGEQRGLQKAILVSLRARYGTVPATVQDKIRMLTGDEAERVLEHLPRCPTLDALVQWLASAQL